MLGPLSNCILDAGLRLYFRHSPSNADIACLRTFFRDLVSGHAAGPCKYKALGNGFLVVTCRHALLIKRTWAGGYVVTNIKPIGGAWHPPIP